MSEGRRRPVQAVQAPPPRPLLGSDQLQGKLLDLLRSKYEIHEPTPFMVFLEGATDVAYLSRAVELAIGDGQPDPLRIPSGVAQSDGERITLTSPGRPGAPYRGGVPQMIRLAQDLKPYVFTIEAFGGVLFVFDGDEAGAEAINQLHSMGYEEGRHILRLSKAEHPTACGDKAIVVEDLLSLEIQKAFFEEGGATCDAVYVSGSLIRFGWKHGSKGPLVEYVETHGSLKDVVEVLRLADRIRAAFGFA